VLESDFAARNPQKTGYPSANQSTLTKRSRTHEGAFRLEGGVTVGADKLSLDCKYFRPKCVKTAIVVLEIGLKVKYVSSTQPSNPHKRRDLFVADLAPNAPTVG